MEASTTKKTMLKNTPPSSTPSITGKVASTIGTAPRRPAQPTSVDSRMFRPLPSVNT
ncbi:MAG: hypothetical protein WKF40_10725 [Thermoleophilaceae bacterium]